MKNFTKSLLVCLSFFFVIETKAQFGNALSYNPVDAEFTTMPSGIVSSIPNGTSFTIEAWVYWRGGGNYQRIFDFGFGDNSFGDNSIGYMYMTPSNGGGVAFGFKIPGFPERQVAAGSPLPTNTWSHVAIVVDYGYNDGFGTPSGFLYVNGNRVAIGGLYNYDAGPPIVSTSYYPSGLANATETNWLGHPRSIFDPYFDGIIDELRISNTVRYSGATYTVPTTPFSLPDANTLALYHFDEGTGQTSIDATSNHPAAILGADGTVETADPSWSLSILPVKISQFSVQKAANAVNLKWKASTVDEQGRFVVERSADGSHFNMIGSVDISKNAGTVDYTFTDRSFNSNKNYYRLKIEENNSAPKYSSIVFVNMLVDYAVYPTLASNHIYIAIPKQTNIAIYNSNGVVFKKARLISSQDLDITTLASGVYYVKFEDSKQVIPFNKL